METSAATGASAAVRPGTADGHLRSLDRAGGFFVRLGSRAAPAEDPGPAPSRKPKKRRPLQLVPVILRAMVERLEGTSKNIF